MSSAVIPKPVDLSDFTCVYNLSIKPADFPEPWRETVAKLREENKDLDVESCNHIRTSDHSAIFDGYYNGKLVVFKIFPSAAKREKEQQILWEATDVPGVVRVLGRASFEVKADALVLEPLIGTTLTTLRLSPDRPAESAEEIRSLATQSFQFLLALQTPTPPCRPKGIYHRDLSGSNVFWINKQLRVIDFGSACRIGDLTEPETKPYICPPEYLLPRDPTKKRTEELTDDMWSMGILIHDFVTRIQFIEDINWNAGHIEKWGLAMITRRIGPPTATFLEKLGEGSRNHMRFLPIPFPKYKTLKQLHTACNRSSPQLLDLLEKIFRWDRSERISPAQAMQHPYIQSLHTVPKSLESKKEDTPNPT